MFRVPCETYLQYHWHFLLLHLHILLKPLQKLYVPLDTGLRIQKISAHLCRHNPIVHEIHDKDARNAFLNWEAEAWQCLK